MNETERSRLLQLIVPALSAELIAVRFLSGALEILGARAGALWLSVAGTKETPRPTLARTACRPEGFRAAAEIPPDHPILDALHQRPSAVFGATDPEVTGLFEPDSDPRSAVLAMATDPGGVLAFLVPDRRAFPVQRVHELRPVADRLGYALGQALSHRAVEEEVRQLKKELAALRYTAGRLRALVENSLDFLIVLGYDGSIQMTSPSLAEATGLAQNELEGTSIFTLVHPDDVGPFIEEFRERLLQRGLGPARELRLKGLRGWRWVTARLVNRLDDPKVGGVILSLHDITELKRHAEELERARQDAEAMSRARAEFLAAMSHEIRTPMNSVIGLASLLEETDLDEQQREMLHTIRTSGATLVGIINQVLDLARIEAGEIVLHVAPADIRTLVDEVLEVAGPAASEKGLDLIDDIPDSVPRSLLLDAQRIQQILLNLVTNAVKHTEAGSVTVTATVSGSGVSPQLELSVRDTGHGIPESQVARIFEPFMQTAEGVREGGTGLGLAITRQLVEAMGGTIEVRSAIGKGSTFRVTLPVQIAETGTGHPTRALRDRAVLLIGAGPETMSAHAGWLRSEGATVTAVPAEGSLPERGPFDLLVVDTARGIERGIRTIRELREALGETVPAILLLPLGHRPGDGLPERTAVVTKPARRGRLLEAARRILLGGEAPAVSPAGPSSRMSASRPLRILLAEDNPVNRKVATMMLEQLGHRVETVSSGPEVVEATRSGQYDVILMDVELPGFSGLEATRRIRAMTLVNLPYIVAMTGHALPADRERCLAAGMDEFLPKPVVLEELRAVLNRAPVPSRHEEQAAETRQIIVDPDRIEMISAVTPGLLRQLVELFSADAPERIEAIATAIEAGNLHEVAQSAHQLKGAAANMGARELERLACDVENLARTGQRDRLAGVAGLLHEAFEAARTALDRAVAAEDDGFVEW